MPNWKMTYKVGLFKDIFTNFNITHAYSNVLTVSRFNTTVGYDENNRFKKNDSKNYYSRLEIPGLSIKEGFNPLIGIDIKTKSNLSLNFEYKKSRTIDLRADDYTVVDGSELVFGFGFVVDEFKGFSKGSNKKSARKKKVDPKLTAEEEKKKQEEEDNTPLGSKTKKKKKSSLDKKGRKLTVNTDFSIRDDASLIYFISQAPDTGQANRGQKVITFEPNIEYQMYKNLALRFNFSYSRNIPRISLQNDVTNIASGITGVFTFD